MSDITPATPAIPAPLVDPWIDFCQGQYADCEFANSMIRQLGEGDASNYAEGEALYAEIRRRFSESTRVLLPEALEELALALIKSSAAFFNDELSHYLVVNFINRNLVLAHPGGLASLKPFASVVASARRLYQENAFIQTDPPYRYKGLVRVTTNSEAAEELEAKLIRWRCDIRDIFLTYLKQTDRLGSDEWATVIFLADHNLAERFPDSFCAPARLDDAAQPASDRPYRYDRFYTYSDNYR